MNFASRVKTNIAIAAGVLALSAAPFFVKAQTPLVEKAKAGTYGTYNDNDRQRILAKADSTFFALLGGSGSPSAILKETKVFEPGKKPAQTEGGDGGKEKMVKNVREDEPAPVEIKPSYLPEHTTNAKNIIDNSTAEAVNGMDKHGLARLLSRIDALRGKISPNLEGELMRTRGNAEERLSQLEAMEKGEEPAQPPAKEEAQGAAELKQAVNEYVEKLPDEVQPGRQESLDNTLVKIEKAKEQAAQDGGAAILAGEMDRLYEKANAAQDSAAAIACASEMLAFYEANKGALRADQQLWNRFMGKLVNGTNVALERFGCEPVDARMFIGKE